MKISKLVGLPNFSNGSSGLGSFHLVASHIWYIKSGHTCTSSFRFPKILLLFSSRFLSLTLASLQPRHTLIQLKNPSSLNLTVLWFCLHSTSSHLIWAFLCQKAFCSIALNKSVHAHVPLALSLFTLVLIYTILNTIFKILNLLLFYLKWETQRQCRGNRDLTSTGSFPNAYNILAVSHRICWLLHVGSRDSTTPSVHADLKLNQTFRGAEVLTWHRDRIWTSQAMTSLLFQTPISPWVSLIWLPFTIVHIPLASML